MERFAEACRARGLDLVQPARAGWIDEVSPPENRLGGDPTRLAIVVGSARALWSHLAAALRADPSLVDAPHPLERWVDDALRAAAATLEARCELRFAHDPPPRRIAIQRAAHAAGLAHLGPSHLSVHPVYGPWIALHAVVVVDVEGPPARPPALARPCPDCEHACLPHLDAALAISGPDLSCDADGALARHQSAWLAVRDACPIGRAHRYDDDQIRYGYTKDREILRRLAAG